MRGSENIGALPAPGAINSQQYLLAAQGISGFVFDKRGTGRSGGKFVMNFTRLADDMAAASVEARRLAAGRFGRSDSGAAARAAGWFPWWPGTRGPTSGGPTAPAGDGVRTLVVYSPWLQTPFVLPYVP